MRYNYNVEDECFIREDGLGKKYFINITEARRIVTLQNLGNSIPEIRNKISFQSNKVSESTIANFLNQINKGNIDLSGDYPAPSNAVFELTLEERISNLESRMSELENKKEPTVKSVGWRERLGL